VLGMRSGYTCCLANMHQGWTKFASHLWYGTSSKGLAALEYSPNEITTKVGKTNTEITIKEITNYPFEDKINFEFITSKDVAFPMQLRIPSWCKEAVLTLNGREFKREKGGQVTTIDRIWKNNDKLILEFPMEMTTSNWGRNSRTIERGPLVYALKLEEKWEKGNQKEEGDYFSVYPKSDWNYGLLENIVKDPKAYLTVEVKPISDKFVWNLQHAPIEITAPAKKIPNWKAVDGVAHQPVSDRTGIYRGEVEQKTEKIKLVPYGFTKVRIVAFPVVK